MMSLIGIGNQLGFNQQAQQQQPHDDYDDVFSLGGASTGGRHQRKMKLTRSGISLSMDQKSHLIDHIHERPQIWDNNCEGFRSNQTRQNAFNEVAQLLSDASETYTRIQVQEEWGKLRYCFTRIVKKLLEEGNGQINEAQQAAVTWPYWGRMLFLLDGVKQQLQGISTDGDGVQHQENKNSSGESSPTRNFLPPRTRRRRANTSRKSSHDYQEDLSQSPTNNNDLLVSRALGMTPQELVMAKMAAAFNTSHQILNQMKHEENANGGVEPMNAENATVETFNDNIINQANVMAQQQQLLDVSQQQNALKDDQQPAENTASVMAKLVAVALNQGQGQQRRKRKRSNLDFLLPKSIQREEQQPAATTSSKPIVYQTPAKNASDSIFSVSNRSQQPQMPNSGSPQNNETEVTEAEGGGIDKNGFGAEEVAGEDINESFGRYMINQLQTVAKKNPMLCVQMRKELMEVCFKFEMRACKVPQEEDG